MHVPAGEGSSVPVFSDILADIGDEQSLEQSLSTFSSHISRIGHILRTADGSVLVLLDEMGAGTDPTEGAALGRAILDKLDEIGCRAMVTTHLGDLKTYAFNNENAENGAVEFDLETLRPTYTLEIGQFGMSNALKIARRLKLPRDLLQAGRALPAPPARSAPRRWPSSRSCARRPRTPAPRRWPPSTRPSARPTSCAGRPTRWPARPPRRPRLRASRLALKPGDMVRVPKFDKAGKVVRTDFKRNIVVVSVGIGQWEVHARRGVPRGEVTSRKR